MAAGEGLHLVESPPTSGLERSVEEYLTACRARGLAPRTVNLSYGWPLRRVFLPWAREEGLRVPADVTPAALRRFATHLMDSPGRNGVLSKHSVHTYLRSVNQWARWAAAEGEEVADGARAQLPRLPRALPDVLSWAEIASLEAAASTERDRLIVRLLADTGMRVGELVGLRLKDLVKRDRGSFLRVTGKGGRDREVPLVPRLAIRLERFTQKTRPKDTRSDRVFLGLRRSATTGQYEPLTVSGVEQLIRELAERCGMSKRVHPHLFRHSFITNAISQGMDSVLVSRIVGHVNLDMIQHVYAHLDSAATYEAMVRMLTSGG